MMGLVSRVRHSTNDSWRDLSGKGADRDYFLDPSSRLDSPKAPNRTRSAGLYMGT